MRGRQGVEGKKSELLGGPARREVAKDTEIWGWGQEQKQRTQCCHGCNPGLGPRHLGQTGRALGLPDPALGVGTEVGKEEEEDNNSFQLPGQKPLWEKFLEG